MKTPDTLKELLKPPFKASEGLIGDRMNQSLMWLAHPSYVLRKAFTIWKKFVVNALNEKWERDFGEPRFWLKGADGDPRRHKCPVCKYAIKGDPFKFCPECGARLFRPKEKAK
ncbi:MAG: hypothetical protein FWE09_00210 [Treponema sp.]|nr:hypothetical protein [Treponema sp.]